MALSPPSLEIRPIFRPTTVFDPSSSLASEWTEKGNGRKKERREKNWKKKAVDALYTRYSGEENNGKARVFRPGEGRIAVAHKPEQSRVSAGLIYERRGTASENSNRNGGILYCNRSPAPGKD